MSASRESKNRRNSVPQPEGKKKLGLQTILAIVAVVLVIAIIAAIVIVRGPFLMKKSTAVKIGNYKLSPVEFRYFYYDAYNTLLNNGYSYLLSAYFPSGVDNLDEQSFSEDQTWGDYLTEYALNQAKSVYAVYGEAVKNGYKLSQEEIDEIDSLKQTIDLYASYSQLASGDTYLSYYYGTGSTWESYRNYLMVTSTASGYSQQYTDSITVTQDEIVSAYNSDPTEYNSYTFHVYSVRASYESDADDAAITAAMSEAKERADKIKDGSSDLNAFLSLVGDDSGSPESYASGAATLRSNYRSSSMSAKYKDWVIDSSRVQGDTTVIEDTDSHLYYVLYYVSFSDNDYKTVNARMIELNALQLDDGTYDFTDADAQAVALQNDYSEGIKNGTDIDTLFETLVSTYGSSSSQPGGLYENIYNGYLDETVNNWLFSGENHEGSTTIVKSVDTGKYYFVYFVGENEQTYRDYMVDSVLRSDKYTAWSEQLLNSCTVEKVESGMKRVIRKLAYTPSTSAS